MYDLGQLRLFEIRTHKRISRLVLRKKVQVIDTQDTRLLKGHSQRSARPVDTDLEGEEGICERLKFGIDSDSVK